MDRTPSPRRLRTPPAPHHGFTDSYEPYSPRRSTRVAAQRDIHLHQGSQQSARARRDITPTATYKRKATARTNNNFTLSPPSSPISSPQLQSPRSMRRRQPEASALDSESEATAPSTAHRFPNKQMSLLPTPSETPRKRPLVAEASLKKTARVLFPARPANIEEVMPTPRKSRKKNLFTLESFANAADEPAENIQIFTDSKERVPEQDDEEDNPFVTKKGKGKAKAVPQKSQRAVADSARVKETIDRDEGMVYLFRGRKLYRKFHDSPEGSGGEDSLEDFSALPANERLLRRTAGVEAHRPLRRSTIKPRLLFEAEIKERKRQNGEVTDDEEADTEIETPAETPSRRKGKAADRVTQPATPPPTVRKPKREISFEGWSRVKSAHSSGESVRESKKRGGEPLERGGAKQARSEKSTPATSFSSI
ncbi:hypothetical protein HBI25_046150 [Parastagonospora nodorum]|nr:hypothetical protein HBI09_054570 [Parastagonospora nodorum]KAH4933955.1 hypothetical protein HBH74_089110 [Parastagonospora nodorum]KAH4970517.1 hypothetical protein HBH73_053890 [Parastagonospora nodorum]KAH5001028.1 hypothetical protein HBI77_150630 [Parastagonospora nodorum]KAH5042219.1 hypothetical protein HBI75_036660 [Parastagonospora nodorum]